MNNTPVYYPRYGGIFVSRELQTMNQQNKLALWAGRISECRNSGMAVKTWCRENGICEQTYYKWQRRLFEMARIAEENRPANVSGVKLQHFHLSKRTALFAKSVLDLIRTQNQIWIVVITFPLAGWLLVNTSVLDSLSFSIDPLMVAILATILTMVAFTSVFQVISEQILKMIRKKTVGLELP